MMRFIAMSIAMLSMIIFSSCSSNRPFEQAVIEDSDWNTQFTSNCPLPTPQSIQWINDERRFLRFTLDNKDTGGCSNDNKARHSAPYWERAELKQLGVLGNNNVYAIDAVLRFMEGFAGERESFMQIHAYNDRCKRAYPPIMLKFDNSISQPATLSLFALQNYGHHLRHRSDITIDQVLADWTDVSLKLDTGENRTASLSTNGEAIFTEVPYWVEPCGKLHVKFGAYRPGSISGNKRSIVDFDSTNIRKL